jgi:peptide/nickel transport system ATP-binding protein
MEMGKQDKDIVLKIENLSFGYSKENLLFKDFSLELKRGELISIVGSSGVGKSTLFELITNNLKPLSGTITVANIGWIFQDPYSSFHPSYTILQQIREVAQKKEYNNFLQKLDLQESLLNKFPHQLSGGQLQRCSILRALLMQPDVLLCDEPTSALDNIVALQTMKLIVSLLDEVGVLLITHDLELAKWASDKIIRL